MEDELEKGKHRLFYTKKLQVETLFRSRRKGGDLEIFRGKKSRPGEKPGEKTFYYTYKGVYRFQRSTKKRERGYLEGPFQTVRRCLSANTFFLFS